MLSKSILSTLLLLLSSTTPLSHASPDLSPIVAARRVHSGSENGRLFHRSFSSANRNRNNRRASTPSNLSPGSLTAAEGCTKFHLVTPGEYCYKVIELYGISLAEFYRLNPEIDSKCHNLNAGFSYCVGHGAVSASATSKPATSTTKATSTVKATSTAAAAAAAGDEDGDDCGDEDEDDDESSSTSTTQMPTTTSKPPSKPKAKAPKTTSKSANVKGNAAALAPISTTTSQKTITTTTTTTTTAQRAAETVKVKANSVSSSVSSILAKAGITQWLGTNGNGGSENCIMSWYRTDYGGDSTNGRSWCEFEYNDSVPGFAPSVDMMLANFGGDADAARKAYCGMEAKFTLANGETALLYVADAFADPWVRTPCSVDVIVGAFWKLWKSDTTNKDDVFQELTWEWTGNKSPQYSFGGPGSA